ncbi:MAG TPA: hypothetical protein VI547_08890 [Anaerolineales bacterium]|nr:hypothetical protein [Anaerolineales bacterium]HLF02080.1 hypothetical protein [Anaerolineales bacterium]
MNDDFEFERETVVINDALRTHPLDPAPPTLATGVMARLRALPANIRPRFRLSPFDYAISLFTTGMAGVSFVLWQSMPPQVMAQMHIEWLLFLQRLFQYAPFLQTIGRG